MPSIQGDKSCTVADTEGIYASSNAPGEIAKRISALVGQFASRVEAARVAGLSTDQLARYEEGAAPRLEPIARLCQAKGWSLDYIWQGRPAPGRGESDDAHARHGDGIVYVPKYDAGTLAGSAGLGQENAVGYCPLPLDMLRSEGWEPTRLALIKAGGDSQEGLIDDGQLVLVNLGERDIRREGIYALLVGGYLMFKIAQTDHRGTLLLRSNNPAYREIAVPRDQIDELTVVGRAVWTDHRL